MSLLQIFESNTDLPINKWLHYIEIYERYFSPFVGREIFFLEIGTGQGGSARMWKRFLGPRATVVTLDIREECRQFETDAVSVRIGSQDDPAFLQSVLDEFGSPSVVLDDGSHVQSHMNATLRFLYPRMQPDGIYMIEDTHTSYWPAWEGGLRKPGTFIEEMKTVIDGLHADNPHNPAQSSEINTPSAISTQTKSVHFYPSVVVLEKGTFGPKREQSIPFVPDSIIY